MVSNRRLLHASYAVAAAFIVLPVVQTFMSILPLRMGDAQWRYGSVGMMSNALMMPTAGVVMAALAAHSLGHRAVQRALGIACAILGIACVLAVGAFGLDALQAQGTVRSEMRLSFAVATTAGIVRLLLVATAFTFVAVHGMGRRGHMTSERPSVLLTRPPARTGKAEEL
jgi:hypothetical protein